MSDFLKKFKAIFIIEDEKTAKAAESAGHPAEAAGPQSREPQQPPVAEEKPVTPVSTGGVNDKFLEILFGVLDKNNQPGFDYLEFRQALLNLANMPMDEATRYRSAFAMAQTMGVTTAKLVETAKFYLQLLGQENDRFREAHQQQRDKLIGNRENEIRDLEVGIQQKSAQIAELQKQIADGELRMENLKLEIHENTVKIENTRADFEASLAHIASQIESDVAKIQQYASQ